MKYYRFLPLILLVIIALGCANPFRQNYQSTLDKWPRARERLLDGPETSKPTIVTSSDLRTDSFDLLANGYVMIGKSKFVSPPINERHALAYAKEVGADVVLVNQEYVKTVTESVPITEWMPDRRITTRERSTFQTTPSSQPSVYQREITQTLEGESYTRYVQKNTEYFDYTATFWRKAKPHKFGVLVHGLDDAAKKRLQTNRGVVVRIVVNRSPAYYADILRDDIITHFNGSPVNDPEDFFEKIEANAGKEVAVKILRDGVSLDISLTLLEN